ncbi:serine hydroxymethyltransferase [Candidatus Curtissbacteria bacterium RIFCSPLOWO2_02_FULL_40_13b]|uniref:Serine hydroxymethyltransferase n=1 Tax=Candidatus Curtissbacteria bacterium RIFCSPLOWO2_02_FULL_40_13b TaxID=1797733 RepID=A0A1F5HXU3_9BACT|nr:MAG: serine hydroxymethyltransferase [Candidatus Curtissbacteria bacterium RIFCSPLOWO2_02_FULL_40_13b]
MTLLQTDPQIAKLIALEEKRQTEVLEMIPSENYASRAVMQALATVLTNKYSEGYPKKRYYQGNKIIDEVEILAQGRAKKLFGVPHANVQPYSGSPANTAIYLALCQSQNDKIMGLTLAFGGHLTHGAPVSISGKYFKAVPYELGKNGYLDYDQIEKLATAEKPKIIVCGFTAYPRIIDFKKFGQIADSCGAYLLADVSHIAGLIVAGVHPSPVPYSHIVMTTTHKTLRGPRGAIIMVTQKGLKKEPELAEKIDKAVFPGLQGGPHDNQTAAIAVALKEASTPTFKKYGQQIVKNTKALTSSLSTFHFDLSSGGSDNHLILIDLRNKGVNGAVAAIALEAANIVVNKNAVPFDTNPPFYPSGIRLGTPAITTRGMKEAEMKKIAQWISLAIDEVKNERFPDQKEARIQFMKGFRIRINHNQNLKKITSEVKNLTKKFPIP